MSIASIQGKLEESSIKLIDEKNDIEDKIKIKYAKYIDDSNYVYKKCKDYLIVILKKLKNTITNENRKNIFNPSHAKYRGNHFEVSHIFSLVDLSDEIKTAFSFHNAQFYYTVGKIVEVNNYNMDEIICSTGIHYFKDIMTACCYNTKPDNYSGAWKTYYDNGQLCHESKYINGKLYGKLIVYCEDGNPGDSYEYVNDKLNGIKTEWYKNFKRIHDTYNSPSTAPCTDEPVLVQLYPKTQIHRQYNYVNNIIHGKFTEWYGDGTKYFECEYVNGLMHGVKNIWNRKGKIESSLNYINGILYNRIIN